MKEQAVALEMVELSNNIEEDTSDSSEIISPESIRKLARLRRNLAALRSEISDKILQGAKECRKDIQNTIKIVGELNATLINKDK